MIRATKRWTMIRGGLSREVEFDQRFRHWNALIKEYKRSDKALIKEYKKSDKGLIKEFDQRLRHSNR